MINGDFTSRKQPALFASYYNRKSLDYSNLSINFIKTAFEVNSQLRAYNFRAYQLPKVYNHKVSHSKILDQRSINKPGSLINESKKYVIISTIDYNLKCYKDGLVKAIDYAKKDDVEKLKILNNSGYNLFEKFNHGWDLCTIATYYGSWTTLKYLIYNGFNIFTKNVNGTNILMYTIASKKEEGKEQMVTELINKGLDPNMKDYSGKSTMTLLNELNKKDLINII